MDLVVVVIAVKVILVLGKFIVDLSFFTFLQFRFYTSGMYVKTPPAPPAADGTHH